ncbi:hypothetical protein C8Q80DRAFT_402374 [Daedaleopsis nitida]|nr:hypothetical protein C8Q80DRAFT_402374 [Daedaleopsis nitida]
MSWHGQQCHKAHHVTMSPNEWIPRDDIPSGLRSRGAEHCGDYRTIVKPMRHHNCRIQALHFVMSGPSPGQTILLGMLRIRPQRRLCGHDYQHSPVTQHPRLRITMLSRRQHALPRRERFDKLGLSPEQPGESLREASSLVMHLLRASIPGGSGIHGIDIGDAARELSWLVGTGRRADAFQIGIHPVQTRPPSAAQDNPPHALPNTVAEVKVHTMARGTTSVGVAETPSNR